MANKVAVLARANYVQLKSGIEFKVANNVRPAIKGRQRLEWVKTFTRRRHNLFREMYDDGDSKGWGNSNIYKETAFGTGALFGSSTIGFAHLPFCDTAILKRVEHAANRICILPLLTKFYFISFLSSRFDDGDSDATWALLTRFPLKFIAGTLTGRRAQEELCSNKLLLLVHK